MLVKDRILKKYYNFYIYILFFLSLMNLRVLCGGKNFPSPFGDKFSLNSIDMNLYNNCFGVVIIGGGPAGLTAGLYSSRFGLPTGVFTGPRGGGGQLTTTGVVENFPGVLNLQGTEIINNCRRQAESAGSIILHEEVKSIDTKSYPYKIITDKEVYYTFSIVIATGSSVKKLGCKGEDLYWGKGVSSCAICDGSLHKNQVVCVIGGGDSACEEALQLVPHAKKIYILVRGDAMRASSILQERVKKNSKITILYNTEVDEIKGDSNEVFDVVIRSKKENKSYSLAEKYNHKSISGVFIAIGHLPNTSLVKNIVDLNDLGNIICQGRTQATSCPFIFACGDVVANAHKQASVACGQGTSAAIEAFESLQSINVNTAFFNEYNTLFCKKKSDSLSEDDILTAVISDTKETDALLKENLDKSNTVVCDGVSCLLVANGNSAMSDDAPKIESHLDSAYTQTQVLKKYKEVITGKEYESLSNKKNENHDPVYDVLYLYGSACPACVEMKRVIQSYVKNSILEIPVYGINIEKLPSISREHKIKSIPTLIVRKNGKPIGKRVGSFNDLKEFELFIKKYTN